MTTPADTRPPSPGEDDASPPETREAQMDRWFREALTYGIPCPEAWTADRPGCVATYAKRLGEVSQRDIDRAWDAHLTDKARGGQGPNVADLLFQIQRLPPDIMEGAEPVYAWVDDDGIGWSRHPEWTEPWSEDGIQNEWAKGRMLAYLTEIAEKGIAAAGVVDNEFARQCRRLGFYRLAEASYTGPKRDNGMGSDDAFGDWTGEVYDAHEAAMRVEAQRRLDLNMRTQETWQDVRGTLTVETIEQTLADLTFGPFNGPVIPEGKTLAPLNPYNPAATPQWTGLTAPKRKLP